MFQDHVGYYLELLLVDMGVEAKSNDMLESIKNGMVSLSILSVAFIQVWNMGHDYGCGVGLLDGL